jgi:hypothetical protein
MNPDDLYPNDSAAFLLKEPPEQAREKKKEKAETLQSLSVLREVVARLDERIAFYTSIDSIPDSIKTDPEKFLIMHNSREMTRDSLREERDYIVQLIDSTDTKGA